MRTESGRPLPGMPGTACREQTGCLPNDVVDFGAQEGLFGRAAPPRQVAKAGGGRQGAFLWLLYIDQPLRHICGIGPGSRPLQPQKRPTI